MNIITKKPSIKAVVEQITNNTISWIGHQKMDNIIITGGQTFIAPSDVELEAIEVFTVLVTIPGKFLMTLHHFDTQLKLWGPVLVAASVAFHGVADVKGNTFDISGLL